MIAAAFLIFKIVFPHQNTTFNEIAIQPRPASPATVTADANAELAQAKVNGGQLLVAEIAGAATTSPALSTKLSCPAGTNKLMCAQKVASAVRTATAVVGRLAGNPAPANLDVYSIFELTANYLSQHPSSHEAINLWINTTARQLAPVNLTKLSTESQVAGLARGAVRQGAFPGQGQCQGYRVHMVVPPAGSLAHQKALRELFSALIRSCGGRLVTWTSRWIPGSGLLTLPPIPGVPISSTPHGISFTLSEKLGDFSVGSAALSARVKARLARVAADIEEHAPNRPVTCVGSTDGTGSAAFDKALSTRRATAVCEYLATQGISPKLLRAVGKGKATPTAANPSLRRVIVVAG